MVKASKNRKDHRRRSSRRAFGKRRVLNFPPVIPFHTVFMDIVLRNVIGYPSQPINSRIDIGISFNSIFDGVWTSLRGVFSQVKLKKVHVYVMSGVGLGERGYHAMNLAPKNEYQINEKTTFQVLTALPGTKMARITQMVTGVWFPTEPADKSWNLVNSQAALVEMTYMSKDIVSSGTASSSYPVEITIDAHVKLRGVNYQRLQIEHANNALDVEFVHLAT